jgi:4-amino-4-deoxy-L-arabinose transferase-like glycosyltransferase
VRKGTDTELHSEGSSSSRSWLSGPGTCSFDWADVVVIPLILILSVPPLMWFKQHWTVIGNDSGRYLLDGAQLISGQALENLNNISEFNAGHGPILPAMVGTLILLFGRDTAELAWTARLLTLLNPLLAYFLVKRISSSAAGLMAAALVTLLSYNVDIKLVANIDAPMLTFYLLSLLSLLAAIKRNSSPVAFLSGVLLGVCILTKETAVVNLPLALLAVLLLDWEMRKALWHYLGVVLVCLPWWMWAYSATGEVYLVDRLPARFQIPLLIGAVIFVVLAALAYVLGMVDRFLADERRRRWTGLFVALLWALSLSGMLLTTATRALSTLSLGTLGLFLAHLLDPAIFVVPTLIVVVEYVVWKALRHKGAWRLLALAMLFQVPVCLLVTVERWAPRQFLILQTLVFCALGALVVEAGVAALRERDFSTRLVGAVVAVVLASSLLVGSVEKVQALLPQDFAGGFSGKRKVAYPETEMAAWMAQNVPEGKHILVLAEPSINVGQANYLMFLDGGRHEWEKLRLDQGMCQPRPNVQMRCDPSQNDVSKTPPDAVWIQKIGGRCRVISLSMPNLLKQVRQSGSDYVLISGSNVFPGILQLPLPLQASKAFKVVNAELVRTRGGGANQVVVLLKSTGRTPKAVPTRMNAKTALTLERCDE